VDALSYLRGGGASTTLNVGYGHGYSVRQVLVSVERVSGKRLVVARSRAAPGIPRHWWRAPIASGPSSAGAAARRSRRHRAQFARLEERLLREPW